MTAFADVEQFVRQHAACGGLMPRATPQAGGGFLLRLTCSCGATLDRVVSPDEAKQPLPPLQITPQAAPASPPPAPTRPARPSTARPRATPSPEVAEALRAAIEAEPDEVAAPATPPPPAMPGSREDLEALVRDALAAEEARSAAPQTGTRPARPAPARLDLDATIRRALEQQRVESLEEAPTGSRAARRVWVAILLVAALGVAGVVTYTYMEEWSEEPAVTATGAPAAPRLPPEQRAALEAIVTSLRQLQTSTPPNASYPVYSSRVLVTKADVDKFAASTVPVAARTSAREILDLHLLASTALRSRSLDRKDAWEALTQNPALDLCPEVKSVLDRAFQAENVSPEQARGAAVAAAVPQLWECARGRLVGLERLLGER